MINFYVSFKTQLRLYLPESSLLCIQQRPVLTSQVSLLWILYASIIVLFWNFLLVCFLH